MLVHDLEKAWAVTWLTAVPNDKRTIYKRNQDRLRYLAIEYQYENSNTIISWSEFCDCAAWFEKKAKQYGLVKEFQEEGII